MSSFAVDRKNCNYLLEKSLITTVQHEYYSKIEKYVMLPPNEESIWLLRIRQFLLSWLYNRNERVFGNEEWICICRQKVPCFHSRISGNTEKLVLLLSKDQKREEKKLIMLEQNNWTEELAWVMMFPGWYCFAKNVDCGLYCKSATGLLYFEILISSSECHGVTPFFLFTAFPPSCCYVYG